MGAIKSLQRFRSVLSAVKLNETSIGTFAVPGILHCLMLLQVSCWYRVGEGKQHTQCNFGDMITELLEYSPDLEPVTSATPEEKSLVRVDG